VTGLKEKKKTFLKPFDPFRASLDAFFWKGGWFLMMDFLCLMFLMKKVEERGGETGACSQGGSINKTVLDNHSSFVMITATSPSNTQTS
jgi:hypothetical protein